MSRGPGIPSWAYLVIILIVVQAAVFVFFVLRHSPIFTFQDVLEAGEDRDGDGFPDAYARWEPGDTVEIRDLIVNVEYRASLWPGDPDDAQDMLTAWLPYQGTRWSSLRAWGRAPAWVADHLGAFAYGDWVDLVGSFRRATDSENRTFEFIVWTVQGGLGQITPPVASVYGNATLGPQYSMVVGDVDRRIALIHYRMLVYLPAGQAIDLLEPIWGRGVYSWFNDSSEIGYLDSGDWFYVDGLEAGDYTIVLEYAFDSEVARFDISVT